MSVSAHLFEYGIYTIFKIQAGRKLTNNDSSYISELIVLPLDQDVYDAGALWSSVGPLSGWSVANRSNSITIPDFTAGSWKTNQPVVFFLI